MLMNMQEVLERGFEVLNMVYFDNSLMMPVITIMSSPRTNGHFTTGKTWRAEDNRLHEINISAEHLDRPIENIMATLCHEMIHYFCLENGIKDTSQNGRYHNKRFKEEAEKRGLLISYDKSIGYSITTPSEEFKNVLREYDIEKPIDINRESEMQIMTGGTDSGNDPNGLGGIDGKQRKKSSTRKYKCPKCGNSFRATKDINVLCIDCLEIFEKVMK